MTQTAAYADFSIKARCSDLDSLERLLLSMSPRYLGQDNQTDTYFSIPVGRMKLRQGNIECLLTHYLREEGGNGLMKTTVFLYKLNPSREVVRKCTGSLREIGQVKKCRKIYFIDNVKFHLDRLADGRTFVEIEAIDREGTLGLAVIRGLAEKYRKLLAIEAHETTSESYINIAT
jgi:adenylate cyclase class 2